MADTANEVRIGEISAQLTKASRLVLSTDGFWVQTGGDSQGNSQSVLIPAEFVRAYLTDGIKPSIGDDGMWYVNGKSTGVVAKGVPPQLRGGVKGVEASYDNGKTWTQVAAYSDINVDVAPLVEEYKKIIDSEKLRVQAENTRVESETARATAEKNRATAESLRETAETGRADAETARVKAEQQRETDFNSAKSACETATANANTATGSANTAKGNADKAAAAANTAASSANTAKTNADKATAAANKAAADANASAANANEATTAANSAANAANTAKANAESATSAANKAASDANTSAANANKAITNANNAASNAATAADSASTAADKANCVVKTMEDNMQSNVNEVETKANEAKDTIDGLVNGLAVTQTTGDSATSVMSQKAVTEAVIYTYKSANVEIKPNYISAVFNDTFIIVYPNGKKYTGDTKTTDNVLSAEIPVKAGETYLVSGSIMSTGRYPIVCLVNNDNIITFTSLFNKCVNQPIEITEGITKMLVCFDSSKDYAVYLQGNQPRMKAFVRTQLTKELIEGYSEELTWKGGGLGITSGVGTVPEIKTAGGSQPKYIDVECKENDAYYLSAATQYNYLVWAFLDAEGKLLSCYPTAFGISGTSIPTTSYANQFTGIVIAPEGSARFVVNVTNKDQWNFFCYKAINPADKLKNLVSDFSLMKAKPTKNGFTFKEWSGQNIGDTITWEGTKDLLSKYYIYDVSEGQMWHLKINLTKFSQIVFLDKNDKIIWKLQGNYISQDFTIVVPHGVTQLLVVCGYAANWSWEITNIGTWHDLKDDLSAITGIDETWRIARNDQQLTIPDIGGTVDMTSATSSAWYKSAFIEAAENDTFIIEQGYPGDMLACIMDENYVVLAKESCSDGYISISAPSGSKWFYVNIHQEKTNAVNGKITRNSRLRKDELDIAKLQSYSIYPYDFVVAPTFYAVKGYQKTIYQDQLIRGLDDGLQSPSGLFVEISSSIQKQQSMSLNRGRSWRTKISVDAGTYTLRFSAYNSYGVMVKDKIVNLKVTDAIGLTSPHNILVIGDSTTAGGQTIKCLYDRFLSLGGIQPTFVGTKSNIIDGVAVYHEGISGWKIGSFTGTSSPFYDSTNKVIDITAYRNRNNISSVIDLVIINLGINDAIGGGTGDMSALKTLVEKFLADNTNCKIVIELPTSDANSQEGGWECYGRGYYRMKQSYTANIWTIRNNILISFCTENYKAKVYIGDAASGLDRYYGYPYNKEKDNPWSPEKEFYHTNSVHPNNAGYAMIADGYFFQALSILSEAENKLN